MSMSGPNQDEDVSRQLQNEMETLRSTLDHLETVAARPVASYQDSDTNATPNAPSGSVSGGGEAAGGDGDFNDFFNNLANKYGLFPSEEDKRVAAHTPGSSASPLGTTFSPIPPTTDTRISPPSSPLSESSGGRSSPPRRSPPPEFEFQGPQGRVEITLPPPPSTTQDTTTTSATSDSSPPRRPSPHSSPPRPPRMGIPPGIPIPVPAMPPPPEMGSPHDPGAAPPLEELNHRLRDAGFSGITHSECTPSALMACLHHVLAQYDRRGAMVQELLAAQELARQREERSAQQFQRMRFDLDEAVKHGEIERRRAEEAMEANLEEGRRGGTEERKLRQARDHALQKLAQCEHIARAKESHIQKLQVRLEEKVRKEEHRSTRDKEIYDRIKRQVAQPKGNIALAVRELKAVEVVSLYEAQRDVMERELSTLRAHVRQLGDEMKEKDNYIQRRDKGGGWRTEAAGVVLERQAEAERRAWEAQRDHQATEARAADIQRAAHIRLNEAEARAAALAEENASLIIELEARPTNKVLRDAERRADKLQAKLERVRAAGWPHYAQATGEEGLDDDDSQEGGEELAERMKKGPTLAKEQMRRDRALHRLQLHRVARLPKDIVVELVQDACIQLELNDVGLLEGALAKLLRVVGAVPRMEKWIADVCEVVFGEGHSLVDAALGRSPQQVPAVLRSWLGSMRTLHDLHDFKQVVHTALSKRGGGGGVRGNARESELAAAVRELVEVERGALLTQANFQSAEALLSRDPEALLQRALNHFRHVFEVPSLEGVLPKVNTLYVKITEHDNFMRVLRQVLGLDDSAGVNACLARLRQVLDSEERREPLLDPDLTMGALDPSKLRQPAGTVQDPASEVSAEQLAQHVGITNKLMELFALTSPAAVVPHLEDLQDRSRRMQDALPRYQAVLSQLYDLLRVNTMDEVVPSVELLVRNSKGGAA